MATVHPFPQSEILSAIFDFFRYRKPELTAPVALEVVRALSEVQRTDHKAFAITLRREFAARGYPLQHVHALNLAARLMGYQNWPLMSRTLDALTVWSPWGVETQVKAWDEAIEFAQQVCLQRQSSSRELVLHADARGVSFNLRRHDRESAPFEELIVAVNPAPSNERWWKGARSALENMRRRLEEGRRFFIDGYLAVRLCSREYPFSEPFHALHLPDAGNSELILMQQDHPDEAYEMIEIARGDELECFVQLERSLDAAPGTLAIDVADGTWIVKGRRFRWALSTLRPHDYVPGIATLWFEQGEVAKLKHRYQIAGEILRLPTPRRAARKSLVEMDGPREHYRVNRHAILLALNKVGLTWESYCKEHEEEAFPTLEETMPLCALIDFAKRVELPDPNVVFARPTRAELVRAESSEVLRALYLRIDHVVFKMPASFDREEREQVSHIVQEFAESVRAYQLIRNGVMQVAPDDTVHLAWINDAQELFDRARSAGFTLYVGRIPRLFPMEEVELPQGISPFAFGHSLYLDFDRQSH